MLYPDVLEIEDAKILRKALETTASGELGLRLVGFVFHSGLAVDQVQVSRTEGSALVRVMLVPVRRGKDGNFDVRVPLTSPTERVLFGNRQAVVWPEQGDH